MKISTVIFYAFVVCVFYVLIAHIHNAVLISKGVVVLDEKSPCDLFKGEKDGNGKGYCSIHTEFSHAFAGGFMMKTKDSVYLFDESKVISTTTESSRYQFFKNWL